MSSTISNGVPFKETLVFETGQVIISDTWQLGSVFRHCDLILGKKLLHLYRRMKKNADVMEKLRPGPQLRVFTTHLSPSTSQKIGYLQKCRFTIYPAGRHSLRATSLILKNTMNFLLFTLERNILVFFSRTEKSFIQESFVFLVWRSYWNTHDSSS